MKAILAILLVCFLASFASAQVFIVMGGSQGGMGSSGGSFSTGSQGGMGSSGGSFAMGSSGGVGSSGGYGGYQQFYSAPVYQSSPVFYGGGYGGYYRSGFGSRISVDTGMGWGSVPSRGRMVCGPNGCSFQ